jgi:hypothetical protein
MAFRLDCITIILCLSSAAFKRILFLMAQNLISITMFSGIDWTETSWRCSICFFLTWSDIQCRLHFCFVCRYCADTLPWARGRPRPWMFFLLLHFFFFSDYNFLHLPRAGILLHPLLSSYLFCSNNITTASGGHRHSFLCLETFLVSPTFLHTPRLHFQA